MKNGDFTDLSGLQEMPNSWYAGLPNGWSALLSDGRRITYLVNYRSDKVTVPVTLSSGGGRNFDVYNPMDGTIQHQELPGTLTIQGNASLMVVESPR